MGMITIWDKINSGKGEFTYTNRRVLNCDFTVETKRSPETMGISSACYFTSCEPVPIGCVAVIGEVVSDPEPDCLHIVTESYPSPFAANQNYCVMVKGANGV